MRSHRAGPTTARGPTGAHSRGLRGGGHAAGPGRGCGVPQVLLGRERRRLVGVRRHRHAATRDLARRQPQWRRRMGLPLVQSFAAIAAAALASVAVEGPAPQASAANHAPSATAGELPKADSGGDQRGGTRANGTPGAHVTPVSDRPAGRRRPDAAVDPAPGGSAPPGVPSPGNDPSPLPDVETPPVELPPVELPDVRVPDIRVPDVALPEVTLPRVEVPACRGAACRASACGGTTAPAAGAGQGGPS